MKEFDIDKIGKGMPYDAPSEEFFDNFEAKLFDKIESTESEKTRIIKLFVPISSIAAALVVGFFVFTNVKSTSDSTTDMYAMNDSAENYLESYIESLSDDELATLLTQTSTQDDFYSSLPTNE